MASKPKPSIKTGDIQAAMAKKWAAPEYAIMWEVGEGTGAMGGRYADAVIMSLWPSRGLELHGVEIKVSRADWKREAADPTKAEAIAQYCDRWWIHTPPGIVGDLSELPPAWGLREWDGRNWRTIREAAKTDAATITRPFLAALLRRADGAMARFIREATQAARDAAWDEQEKLRAGVEAQIEQGVQLRTRYLAQKSEEVEAFNAAFGSGREDRFGYHGGGRNPKAWGAAAKALAAVGNGYGDLVARLRDAADRIEELQALTAVGKNDESI